MSSLLTVRNGEDSGEGLRRSGSVCQVGNAGAGLRVALQEKRASLQGSWGGIALS